MATTKKAAARGSITLTVINDNQVLHLLCGSLTQKDRERLIEQLIESDDANPVYKAMRRGLHMDTKSPQQLKDRMAERLLKDAGKKSLMLVLQNFEEGGLRERAISSLAANQRMFTYVLDRWAHGGFTPNALEKAKLLAAIIPAASSEQCAALLNLDLDDLGLTPEQRLDLVKRRFIGPKAGMYAFDHLQSSRGRRPTSGVKSLEERNFLLQALVDDPGSDTWPKGYYAMYFLGFNLTYPAGDFRHFELTEAEQKLLLPAGLAFLLSEDGIKEWRTALLGSPLSRLLSEGDRAQLLKLQQPQAA